MDFSIRQNNLGTMATKDLDKEARKEKQLKALRESTREFEALYVNEMFKAMRKTIPEDGIFKKDMTTKMFQEMMDMEMARETAKGEGIGLGLAMYEQMKTPIENKK